MPSWGIFPGGRAGDARHRKQPCLKPLVLPTILSRQPVGISRCFLLPLHPSCAFISKRKELSPLCLQCLLALQSGGKGWPRRAAGAGWRGWGLLGLFCHDPVCANGAASLPTWTYAGFSMGFLPCLAPGIKEAQGSDKLFGMCLVFSLPSACCLRVLCSSKPCRMPALVLAASEGQEGEAPLVF